ncbi:hypothetical protein AMAG_00329 [Allomyces macrogynus ATCC 38327]|uniref:DUF1740-domain-containing protein n=1 Tax=Allomyces macrogynus (strain ATCC 38327) TaxID=578462 RepID=A0A0L0RW77_ALLM3|nr:hypothetical protein AMAG_00329 [Allomyces macrogynus ATCC 38327]|eukprot:KNE54350.1 hypothetical protein AMAG_00329 [Allomyces macrogynus ATCC 38327]
MFPRFSFQAAPRPLPSSVPADARCALPAAPSSSHGLASFLSRSSSASESEPEREDKKRSKRRKRSRSRDRKERRKKGKDRDDDYKSNSRRKNRRDGDTDSCGESGEEDRKERRKKKRHKSDKPDKDERRERRERDREREREKEEERRREELEEMRESAKYFTFDHAGDLSQLRAPCMNVYQVPRYRRLTRRVLGLPSNFVIDEGAGRHEKGIHLTVRGAGTGPVTRFYHPKVIPPTPAPLVPGRRARATVGPSALTRDFIAFPASDDDEPDPDALYVIDKHGTNDPDDSSRISINLDPHLEKVKAFNVHLGAHPDDIDQWLAFVAFQAENPAVPALELAERQLAILDRALTENANHPRLLRTYLRIGAESGTWTKDDVVARYRAAMRAHPTNRALGLDYLAVRQAQNGVDAGLAAAAQWISTMHDQLRHDTDAGLLLVHVFARTVRLLHEAGFTERAHALVQAQLEITLAHPYGGDDGAPVPARWDCLLDDMCAFWDSEVARLGEPGAKGWRAWTKTVDATSRRYGCASAQSLDNLVVTRVSTLAEIQAQAAETAADANGDAFAHWFHAEQLSVKAAKNVVLRCTDPVLDPLGVVLFDDIAPYLVRVMAAPPGGASDNGLFSDQGSVELLVMTCLHLLGVRLGGMPFSDGDTALLEPALVDEPDAVGAFLGDCIPVQSGVPLDPAFLADLEPDAGVASLHSPSDAVSGPDSEPGSIPVGAGEWLALASVSPDQLLAPGVDAVPVAHFVEPLDKFMLGPTGLVLRAALSTPGSTTNADPDCRWATALLSDNFAVQQLETETWLAPPVDDAQRLQRLLPLLYVAAERAWVAGNVDVCLGLITKSVNTGSDCADLSRPPPVKVLQARMWLSRQLPTMPNALTSSAPSQIDQTIAVIPALLIALLDLAKLPIGRSTASFFDRFPGLAPALAPDTPSRVLTVQHALLRHRARLLMLLASRDRVHEPATAYAAATAALEFATTHAPRLPPGTATDLWLWMAAARASLAAGTTRAFQSFLTRLAATNGTEHPGIAARAHLTAAWLALRRRNGTYSADAVRHALARATAAAPSSPAPWTLAVRAEHHALVQVLAQTKRDDVRVRAADRWRQMALRAVQATPWVKAHYMHVVEVATAARPAGAARVTLQEQWTVVASMKERGLRVRHAVMFGEEERKLGSEQARPSSREDGAVEEEEDILDREVDEIVAALLE